MRGLASGLACVLMVSLFSGCLSSRPSRKPPPDLRHLLQPVDGEPATNHVTRLQEQPPADSEALDRGLAWLRTHQQPDGHWESGDPLRTAALGLLALTGDPDQAAARKAAAYLRTRQRDNGWWGKGAPPDPEVHALCTWALAEYGLRTGAAEDREALMRAGRRIMDRRHERGGWNDGYGALGRMGNSEISALQLLALHALYARGWMQEELAPAFEAGALHLVEFQDPATGRFGHRFRGVGAPGSAGVSLAALQRTGYAKSIAARKGVMALRDDLQRNVRSGEYPLLAAWFMALAGATEGEPVASEMAARLRERLLPKQQPDGSWPPAGKEAAFGPACSTALCVLMLQADRMCRVTGRHRPPIWELHRGEGRMTVLGTAPIEFFDLPLLHGRTWQEFGQAESLMGELDWRQSMQAIQSAVQAGEDTAPVEKALIRAAGEQLNLGPMAAKLNDYPGWAVALAVLGKNLEGTVPEEGPEVEAYLHRGLKGIRRSHLLAADAYATGLVALTAQEQGQLLRAVIEAPAPVIKVVEAGNRAWRGGGVDMLEAALTELSAHPLWRPLYEKFMVGWNRDLGAAAQQVLNEQSEVLLVLPLVRLVGPDGLLQQWRSEGIEIKRWEPARD